MKLASSRFWARNLPPTHYCFMVELGWRMIPSVAYICPHPLTAVFGQAALIAIVGAIR